MRERDLLSRGRIWGLVAITAVSVAAANVPVGRAESDAPTPGGLDVQPFPGTPDASRQTDIAFPALAPAQIKALSVRGSLSGFHRGVMTAGPSGHGSAFVPVHPFSDGERVAVRATLSSAAAGTASGAPGATRIAFSFTVAVSVRLGDTAPARSAREPAIRRPAQDSNELTHSFRSENWLHPPIVSTSGTDPDPAIGDIFADAENSLQPGPLILGPQGQLIYFQPLQRSAAFNVGVQSYQGQTVLTYWQGYVRYGVGIGRDVILNHQYQRVAIVYAGHGYSADLHDFVITPQGYAFITAYAPVRADLSSVGGSRNGILLDSIIQEIDIATGQVLWEWHASGHIRLAETYARQVDGRPFDWFHINSVQPLPNGNLLISARQTWALYEINMKTGRIALAIGGKHSYFKFGRGADFEWQHDAEMQPDGTITVFDNAYDGHTRNEPESRALRIRLNFDTRRATLVHAYTSNPPLVSSSQGDVQPLADGRTFVGWGEASYFTEFGAGGRQMFNLRFVLPIQSYRGYRFAWWGQPTTPPSIATAATPTGTRVYASWNGATDVATWQVLAGASPTALSPTGQFPKTPQFETAMWVADTEPYFTVQALGSAGQVLGTSATVAR
jgi:hypothetical protein